MSELTSMRNIGKEMEKKLTEIGVTSPETLTQMGAKQAFIKLKQLHPNVCLVHLYTLQAAIEDIPLEHLSDTTKVELKEFSDFLK